MTLKFVSHKPASVVIFHNAQINTEKFLCHAGLPKGHVAHIKQIIFQSKIPIPSTS